jgi:predicted DNA-binding transcriptional regulator YafY
MSRGLLRRAAWAVGQLRDGRSLTAVHLSKQFEVSVRTAYRDLDFLRDEWRVPMAFDRHVGSFVLTEPTGLAPPVTLSRGELVAIVFAEKVLRQYRGTPFESDLASAFRKIQELMPEDVSVSPEILDASLSLDVGPVQTPDAAVFAAVLSALRLRRTALVRYRSLSRGRTSDRRVHPYHVFNHRGDWYMAAFDERRRAVRDFALHRIRRIALTTEAFTIPASFDFRRYAAGAFAIEKGSRPIEVAVRFSARQSRWIRERQWHATGRVQPLLDGGCILRFSAAGLGEVRRWVMQFGADAEILSPRSLRDDVRGELATASALYRKKS